MMKFRSVKTAIQTLLADESEELFRVLGYVRQTENANEFKNNERLVHVYYSQGDFPKSGRKHGPKTHDLTINIDLTASAAAKGDLTVIESTTATAAQKAAAIAAIKDASEVADTAIDEIIEYVYSVLMDARNQDLGFEIGYISNPWIDGIQKDTLLQRGDLVVKTASMKFTCRVQEDVPGEKGNEPATVVIDSIVPAGDTAGAGTIVNNT